VLHPYQRTLLSSGPDHETLLMQWAAHVPCAVHDHADAAGTVHLVRGALRETHYQLTPAGLKAVRTREHHAPDLLQAPQGTLHSMEALTEHTLTVHHYSPPIQGMRVYDLTQRQAAIVPDDCGAWLPEEGVTTPLPWPGEHP